MTGAGSTPRILVLTGNLMFSSRIGETLRPFGYTISFVDELHGLTSAMDSERPDLLIVDLDAASSPVEELLSQVRKDVPSLPVLAFGRHTEPKQLRAARKAGCTQVAVRSTFVEEMPQLVERCLKSDKPASAQAQG
jgi:DNA-binding NtrC family response regulator